MYTLGIVLCFKGEYSMDVYSGGLYVWMPNSDGVVHGTGSVCVLLLNNCIE